MTLSTETCSVTASCDGATTSFAYNFLIPYQADGVTPAVDVFITNSAGHRQPLVLATDFTISGVGNASGGLVTTIGGSSPWASPNLITILRALDYVQPDAYTNTGFLPSTVEVGLDNLAMQTQQLAQRLDEFLPSPNLNTVASLPTAQTHRGSRWWVQDSTVGMAGNYGATVVGGGSSVVSVFCDGTNWVIG